MTATVPGAVAGPRPIVAAEPRVRLVAYTQRPFELAVASARTCYASEFEFVGRLTAKGEKVRTTLEDALPQFARELETIGRLDTPHDQRILIVEAIGPRVSADVGAALQLFADEARRRAEGNKGLARSIYEAGHHTPFQHPTFVFALEGVSRNVVESFLHNHVFYNSEQQSQRYVEMRQAEVHVPVAIRSDPGALRIYEAAVRQAWDAYDQLRDNLVEANRKVMAAIGKIKGYTDKKTVQEAEKKAQEMARYVVPVAAATQMYHTVSGIVLLRYVRMCEASSAPAEARRVVEQMLEEVRRIDPAFVGQVEESPRPRAEHVERRLAGGHRAKPVDGVAELVAHDPAAPALVVEALREVTGSTLPDGELLALLLDPARNPAWADTLNTWDHSPALRTLRHVHYTFRKTLSLTAYAQDQRHRMTPGTRPLLEACLPTREHKLSFHTPDVIAGHAPALHAYNEAIAALEAAILALKARGVPDEALEYLLPNATNVTFHQSGDLLSFVHKWRLRLCFNAQKEIFDASLAELRQVQAVHPTLTGFIGPPCSFVAARQPEDKQDDIAACCPEGDKWCGVKVWQGFNAVKGVPKRPF
jgi:flavin-dependent thymidylate synthase